MKTFSGKVNKTKNLKEAGNSKLLSKKYLSFQTYSPGFQNHHQMSLWKLILNVNTVEKLKGKKKEQKKNNAIVKRAWPM